MAGASGGGGGGGSGGGGGNKVAALLLGAGAGAVIIFATIFGPWGPGKDDAEPPPAPTAAPLAGGTTIAPTVLPATPPRGQQAPASTPNSRQRGPDEVVLTLVTYGLPGRFAPTRAGSNEAIGGEFRDGQACIPDVQFPRPCTIDYIVKQGTNVTIHAGDSKAGYWPVLHSVRGPGCNLDYDISGRDRECTVTLVGDMTFEAKYKGDDGAEFIYPACPHRVSNPPAWLKC